MHANRFLDDAAHAQALAEPLRLRERNREFEAPLFVDLLLERRGTLPPEGGLVKTTVDVSHEIFARDPTTGEMASTWIEVGTMVRNPLTATLPKLCDSIH